MKILRIISAIFVISILITSCAKNIPDETDFLQILKSGSKPPGVQILNWVSRMPGMEFTVTIELEPEYQTGSKFTDSIENTRKYVKEEWQSNSKKSSSPLVNIIVRDSSQVVYIDSEGFGHDVVIVTNIPPNKASVVNFSAPWCDKGKATDTMADDILNSGEHEFHYVTVDTDEETGLTDYLNIVEIPTLMFFDNAGNLVNTVAGPVTKEELIENLNRICK